MLCLKGGVGGAWTILRFRWGGGAWHERGGVDTPIYPNAHYVRALLDILMELFAKNCEVIK